MKEYLWGVFALYLYALVIQHWMFAAFLSLMLVAANIGYLLTDMFDAEHQYWLFKRKFMKKYSYVKLPDGVRYLCKAKMRYVRYYTMSENGEMVHCPVVYVEGHL